MDTLQTGRSMTIDVRRVGPLVVLCGLLLIAACSDSTAPEDSPVGTYQLVAINGDPLPYALFGTEILSATLTLRDDGTYSIHTVSREEDIFTGEVHDHEDLETGTYSLSGSVLSVTESGGFTAEATYSGDEIALDAEFVVFVFRRS